MAHVDLVSPWLTAKEAADRLRVSLNTIYYEVASGRLRAARIGGRRSLRFLPEWLDTYLEQTSRPVEVAPSIGRHRA